MLPSNTAREQKITSGLSYFLRRRCRYYRGIDVMAELGFSMKVCIREQRTKAYGIRRES